MKKLLVFIALFGANLCAFSQAMPSFMVGLRAGGNFSKLSTNDLFNADNQLGYYGGLWFRIGAAGIHFQPEIYLTQKNTKITNVATGLDNKIKLAQWVLALG
jgi:hypothetical protein